MKKSVKKYPTENGKQLRKQDISQNSDVIIMNFIENRKTKKNLEVGKRLLSLFITNRVEPNRGYISC